nr:MAG TPA: hypothetical protein [Caudoviricetes sp.]
MENYSREDSLQNAKHCLPDCFLYVIYRYTVAAISDRHLIWL